MMLVLCVSFKGWKYWSMCIGEGKSQEKGKAIDVKGGRGTDGAGPRAPRMGGGGRNWLRHGQVPQGQKGGSGGESRGNWQEGFDIIHEIG